jgi:hypothetical protein
VDALVDDSVLSVSDGTQSCWEECVGAEREGDDRRRREEDEERVVGGKTKVNSSGKYKYRIKHIHTHTAPHWV